MASTSNLEVKQGDTLVDQLTIVDANGNAQDITGATLTVVVVDRNGTEIAKVTQTSHTTPLQGITTYTIPSATTSTFELGCYDYQAVITLANLQVFTVMVGTINVRYDYD